MFAFCLFLIEVASEATVSSFATSQTSFEKQLTEMHRSLNCCNGFLLVTSTKIFVRQCLIPSIIRKTLNSDKPNRLVLSRG